MPTTLVWMLRDTGPQAYAMLAVLAFACAVGLASIGGWAFNRRVPAGLPVLAFAGAAFVPVVFGGGIVQMGMNAAAQASAEMKMKLIANAVSMAVGGRWITAVAMALPLFAFIVVAGVVGALRGPRRVVPPVIVVLCGLGAAGASLVGAMEQNPIALLFGPAYLIATLAIAAGLSSAVDPKAPTAGPQAAAAAAMLFPLLVCVGETWVVHDGYILSFQAVATASFDMKSRLLENGLDWAEMRAWARGIAISLSGVVALTGAIGAVDDRPGANAGVFVGLVGLVVGLLFVWSPARSLFHTLMAAFA
jgi:hypothetical protein